ncbi:MAG: hypothetical protein ACC656_08515 [Candidatus Heimdallarchaeota archaeon]
MVTLDLAFKNTFMYKVAIQHFLIKKGIPSKKAITLILKNTDFVHQAYHEMQMPKEIADCLNI